MASAVHIADAGKSACIDFVCLTNWTMQCNLVIKNHDPDAAIGLEWRACAAQW
jgi:hypothetical protein